MTALVAIAAPAAARGAVPPPAPRAAAMLGSAAAPDVRESWERSGARADIAIAVARTLDDCGLHPHGGHALDAGEAATVASDATLYYLPDLARAVGASPAALGRGAARAARAAFERLGLRGLGALEGDFAMIVWDHRAERLLALRDFAGRRPLYYRELDRTLLVASSVGALLRATPQAPPLDLANVASVAAGLWTHPPETAFVGIREVPAGHLLTWSAEDGTRVERLWTLPDRLPTQRAPRAAAVEELRHLLRAAVAERLAPDGVTAVTLSGGWDSSAVFATARRLDASAAPGDAAVRAVSISYPPGDPGRENELISAIAASAGATVRWIDVDSIPLCGDATCGAGQRDLPFAHTYEQWNRRLFREARALDARVVLDGAGGDQLFQVSDVHLADLVRHGHWLELVRQWNARRRTLGVRELWRWALHPALPAGLAARLARLRGRAPRADHFARQPPAWFRGDFMRAHGVLEREQAAEGPLPPGALGELHVYLRFPFFARVFAAVHGFGRAEGVESRSPLFDARIVRFMADRPWSDRADRGETKLLLREAMRGALPEAVLAPRARRTGVPTGYFLRQLRGFARPFIDAQLADPLLARLGMIHADRIRDAWAHVQRHDDIETAVRLWFTVQAEAWLRARAPGGAA